MLESVVSAIFAMLGLYLLSGLVFGLLFIFRGIDRVDEGAKGAGWGFRIIVLPGVVALWPVLLAKWRKTS
ncbi:MAG: hypothetical protein R3C61_28620 [Bacteroidia bacterium]